MLLGRKSPYAQCSHHALVFSTFNTFRAPLVLSSASYSPMWTRQEGAKVFWEDKSSWASRQAWLSPWAPWRSTLGQSPHTQSLQPLYSSSFCLAEEVIQRMLKRSISLEPSIPSHPNISTEISFVFLAKFYRQGLCIILQGSARGCHEPQTGQ